MIISKKYTCAWATADDSINLIPDKSRHKPNRLSCMR